MLKALATSLILLTSLNAFAELPNIFACYYGQQPNQKGYNVKPIEGSDTELGLESHQTLISRVGTIDREKTFSHMSQMYFDEGEDSEFVQKTCKNAMPSLGYKEKTDEEILMLLKETEEKNLCMVCQFYND